MAISDSMFNFEDDILFDDLQDRMKIIEDRLKKKLVDQPLDNLLKALEDNHSMPLESMKAFYLKLDELIQLYNNRITNIIEEITKNNVERLQHMTRLIADKKEDLVTKAASGQFSEAEISHNLQKIKEAEIERLNIILNRAKTELKLYGNLSTELLKKLLETIDQAQATIDQLENPSNTNNQRSVLNAWLTGGMKTDAASISLLFTARQDDLRIEAAKNGVLNTPEVALQLGKLSTIGNIVNGLVGAINKLTSSLKEGISEATSVYSKFVLVVDTRLYGLQEEINSDTIKDIVDSSIGASRFVDLKTYYSNVEKLVQGGVAYNVEERALLMTLGDRLSTTFDVMQDWVRSSTLLQQQDVTGAMLGLEAKLNEFLNVNFKDTSYLSEKYDSIASTLLTATSLMNTDQATAFSFAVLKWLGSLYSVGLTGSAIDTIAKGLTALGSGDISTLTSNSNLLTLMAMAAEKAGLSYASVLTLGLDASSVDDLMTAMVLYLQEISSNTSNQVLRSEWADILNMSVTDLRAFSNINATDITNLNNASLNNESAIASLSNLLGLVQGRTDSFSEWSNLENNIKLMFGMNMLSETAPLLNGLLNIIGGKTTANGRNILNEKYEWAWVENEFGDTQYVRVSKKSDDEISALEAETDDVSLYDAYMVGNIITSIGSVIGGTLAGSIIDVVGNAMSGVAMTESLVKTLASSLTTSKTSIFDLANYTTNWNYESTLRDGGSAYLGINPLFGNNYADQISSSTAYVTSYAPIETSSQYLNNQAATIQTFLTVAESVQANAESITSMSEETTDSVDKLYNMLFESQEKPVKVFLLNSSSEFILNLLTMLQENNINLADLIRDSISNSSFADNIGRSIYAVREL